MCRTERLCVVFSFFLFINMKTIFTLVKFELYMQPWYVTLVCDPGNLGLVPKPRYFLMICFFLEFSIWINK